MMKTPKMSAFRGALVAALMLGAASAAAATSDTVVLGGSVSTTASLTITNKTGTGLDLTTTGNQIVKVADLGTVTNNATGLKVTVSSGSIAKADGKTPIPFKVTTVVDPGTTPAAPLAGDFTVASGTAYEVSTSAPGTNNFDLYILYAPATYQDPGTDYAATIDVSVSDNA
jgi:hypothetical protein